MSRSSEDYLSQLQALLPPGAAWTRDPDATLTHLLSAFADELARVDGRAGDLVRETDPRDALELLEDWLRAFGLPDDCTPADAFDTLAEQRAALVARVTATGGATAQYLIDIAAELGFEITITEVKPGLFGEADFGAEFIPGDAIFTFEVNAPATSIVEPEFGNSVFGEPFGEVAENTALECVIRRAAPAHTIPYFIYAV